MGGVGSIWVLKGLSLSMLGRYDESVEAFEEA
ncbi:MAG TPA: tetratricopeptide repeat protein [Methanotrichaceae archaeon]|nr:tetratricopeptide repeat protein [Methanotrichaceae archaeon]